MTIGAIYYLFYYLLITFLTIGVVPSDSVNVIHSGDKRLPLGALFLCVVLIFFIGFRPYDREVFTDMGNYLESWNYYYGQPYSIKLKAENIIFDNLFRLMASYQVPIELIFFMVAVIYFSCLLWVCNKIFPKNTMFAFIVYLAAFSTLSYGTNGIKSGAAASIFLLAIAYRGNFIATIIFSLISYGFHHSMEVPIIIFYVVKYIKNPKWCLWFWAFSVLMGLLHINFFQNLFASFGDEKGAQYMLTEGKGYWVASGFRYDFTLYSAMPVYIGWRLLKKYHIRDEGYLSLYKIYLLTNSFFLLCMYADFVNRIAYLSWFLYPIVLIYPYLKLNLYNGQTTTVKRIAYGHLAFSLFMFFVYYNMLKL